MKFIDGSNSLTWYFKHRKTNFEKFLNFNKIINYLWFELFKWINPQSLTKLINKIYKKVHILYNKSTSKRKNFHHFENIKNSQKPIRPNSCTSQPPLKKHKRQKKANSADLETPQPRPPFEGFDCTVSGVVLVGS